MTSSLVGSEMCIRDSRIPGARALHTSLPRPSGPGARRGLRWERRETVSYTHLTLPTICSV
eukprot:812302-Prorocentrum_lima.AAC.1